MKKFFLFAVLASALLSGCGGSADGGNEGSSSSSEDFEEGNDYIEFKRVRLMDKVGFTEPQEAYSILLPKGWKHNADIVWKQPGDACAGTYRKLKASSKDGEYELQVLPDITYVWSDGSNYPLNGEEDGTTYCETRKPIDAEDYLREIFVDEIGNPQIVKVEENPHAVKLMKRHNADTENELRRYGAGNMNFKQSAVNARVKWKNGKEGLVTLGVTILENEVPNNYNGTSTMVYTTQVMQRTVFKYPAKKKEQASNQFAVIMSSFRSNPAWNKAVSGFWKEVRENKHTVHVGRIRMMDEQTRQMGERAIQRGNDRLREMDNEMRSWEQRQSSQDRMHTEFVKTIREVENFQDANGKYEMTSGYEHVWSRNDGNSFILSNNPNFDPSSVFQDQNWKPMKKVQ
jgi:hypothetical protein